jgi:penicillin-insensitive murein DD-endopeptidase
MKKWICLATLFIVLLCSYRELIHKNSGSSRAEGGFASGSLSNGFLVPYKGPNFSYFSFISYFLMDNGYLHSRLHNTIIDSYRTCEKTCPNIMFQIMECANKHGGKMAIHRTHQLGLSSDFMVIKTRGNGQSKWLDHFGMAHYLHGFDNQGRHEVFSKTRIDFETCAKHILALDDAAKKNGLALTKVIFRLQLMDDLYNTPSGKELKKRGIYFAQWMPDFINDLHDDHYHVDFEPIN